MKTKIFVFLFLVLILAVSCAKTETKNAGTASGQKTEAQAPAPQMTSEDAKADITALMEKRAKEYKITYELSTASGPQTVTEITMAFKGNNKRIDSTGSVNGAEMTNSVFILSDKAYLCTEQPQKMCIITNYQEAKESSFTGSEDFENNLFRYNIQALPSRTIAGVNAKCYRLVSQSTADICYSNDGIILHIKTEQAEMTAKSYSTTVPDSLFVLPAQPQSIEAYQAGLVPK